MGQTEESMDLGVWPRFRSWMVKAGWWWSVLTVGWGRVASYRLLSRLQDSDGDKSDDLVVDVSNEVKPGADCRAAFSLRGFESFSSGWELLCMATTLMLPAT